MLTKQWNGSEKVLARVSATANKGKTSKVALFLPGNSCLCVRTALAQGTIDEDTFIIAIEQDKKTANVIRRQLKTLVKRFHLHVGPIIETHLPDFIGNKKIDFAFLDFCGNLDIKLVQWLLYQSGSFSVGAQVAFTFCTLGRANNFIKETEWELNRKHKWLGIKKSIDNQLSAAYSTVLFRYGSENRFRIPTITAIWAILSCHFKTRVSSCIEYCDSSPMIMVKFDLVGPKNKVSKNARRFLEYCSCFDRLSGSDFGCLDFDDTQTKVKPIRVAAVERPSHLSPQQWAWHINNPNSIRNRYHVT